MDPTSLPSNRVVSLRQWMKADAVFFAAACTDPSIQRYNAVPEDFSIGDAEKTIEEYAVRWRASLSTGRPSNVGFRIVDADTGTSLGQCGIDDWSGEDVVQIGYWLAPSARGHGYATQAVCLLTRWLFEFHAARVFMTIVSGNDPSAAVARRAGFAFEGTMRSLGAWQGARCDVMLFAALPGEWNGPHDTQLGIRGNAGDSHDRE